LLPSNFHYHVSIGMRHKFKALWLASFRELAKCAGAERRLMFFFLADGRPFWPLGGLFSVFNVKCVGGDTSESEREGGRGGPGATGRMRNASDNGHWRRQQRDRQAKRGRGMERRLKGRVAKLSGHTWLFSRRQFWLFANGRKC